MEESKDSPMLTARQNHTWNAIPIMSLLLILSLAFLKPTLYYLIHWFSMKTTMEQRQLEEFAENTSFPIALIAAYLGVRYAGSASRWGRGFRYIFIPGFVCMVLIDPIYLPGGIVLGYSLFHLNTKQRSTNRVWQRISPALAAGLAAVVFWGTPVLGHLLERSYRSMRAATIGNLHSLSFALQSYCNEYGDYPPSTLDTSKKVYWHSDSPLPSFGRYIPGGPATLTTPVAYITSYDNLTDRFRLLSEDRTFAYYCPEGKLGWVMVSAGPNCVLDVTLDDLKRLLPAPVKDNSKFDARLAPFLYDPTNGAGSAGDYFYFNDWYGGGGQGYIPLDSQ